MKLRVEHSTVFEYTAPVYETATEVRLQPADTSTENNNSGRPYCLDFSLQVTPKPTHMFRYTDYFGNTVHHFNLLQSHTRLEITADILVETGKLSGSNMDNPVLLQDFSLESPYIAVDDSIREFARQYEHFADPWEKAQAVCSGINQWLVYEPGVTGVYSTTTEVIELGRGVCQDFAHVMIASCRQLGLPARYVSGYLYGGVDTEFFDRASHAWCEVYGGAEYGWIGLDPTHLNLHVNDNYIKIGTGRDYGDVTLVRGTFKGTATEKLTANVRITSVL